jgi:hypothetical protein
MEKINSFNDNNVLIKPTRQKGEPLVGPDAIMVAIPSELKVMVDLGHAERAVLGKANPFKLFIVKRDKDLPLSKGIKISLLHWQDLSWVHPRG